VEACPTVDAQVQSRLHLVVTVDPDSIRVQLHFRSTVGAADESGAAVRAEANGDPRRAVPVLEEQAASAVVLVNRRQDLALGVDYVQRRLEGASGGVNEYVAAKVFVDLHLSGCQFPDEHTEGFDLLLKLRDFALSG